MAFDARHEIENVLTDLNDQLTHARMRQEVNALQDAKVIADLEEQIAGWHALLDAAPAPAKKATKKN